MITVQYILVRDEKERTTMMIMWLSIVTIVVASIAIPCYSNYQKQKLIEDRKTSVLALTYQILSARPDITMEDIQKLIELSGGTLSIPEHTDPNHQ